MKNPHQKTDKTSNGFASKKASKQMVFFLLLVGMILCYSTPAFCDQEYANFHVEVDFRHYIHTEGQGIACTICHTQLKGGSYIMLGHSACATCHAEHIDVYEMNEETCGVCHPNLKVDGDHATVVLRMSEPPRKIFTHTPYLENICYVCHGAMLDEIVELGKLRTNKERRRIRETSHRFHFAESCDKCHVGMEKDQPPKNHQDDWSNLHRTAAPTFNCQICHLKTTCQNCHEEVY